MSVKIATLATACTILLSFQGLAQKQVVPDVYSVVEKKLHNAVPLDSNTTYKSQSSWFTLYRELFMYGPDDRALNLLAKLESKSKDAKYNLSFFASQMAENGHPDEALAYLSQLGINKPSNIFAYESFIKSWIHNKQPEKALQFLDQNQNAKDLYFPLVLAFYQSDADKMVSLYDANYGDSVTTPYNQLKMLLLIANSYRTKNDLEKTTQYTDRALKMFDTAIAQTPSTEVYHYQDYIDLMNLYAFIGNKTKAVELSERLRKVTKNQKGPYQDSLPGLLNFYKNNNLMKEYQSILAEYVAKIDKIFRFAPEPRTESKLINLLSTLNEKELMEKRFALLMNAPEYACYDDYNCYETKTYALKNLKKHQSNALINKHLAQLITESKEQSFPEWETITDTMGETLKEIDLLPEAQDVARNAESIYLKAKQNHPDIDFKHSFMALAKLYNYANDTQSTKRILHDYVPSSEQDKMIDVYMDAKEWTKAKELMVKEERVGSQNLRLLSGICIKNTEECRQHITFTLNKLTTQPTLSKLDSGGNEQLYHIGMIYHKLGIGPDAEQQAFIQQLYDRELPQKSAEK